MAIQIHREREDAIFERVSKTGGPDPADIESLLDEHAQGQNIKAVLADLELHLKRGLVKYGAAEPPHRLPRSAPPIARDAALALQFLEVVRTSIAASDAKTAALYALWLGDAVQRMGVRRVAPVVALGRRVKAGGKRGHEKAHGSPEEKRRRSKKYADLLRETLVRDPKMSKHRAATIVASKLTTQGTKVSAKTILRSLDLSK